MIRTLALAALLFAALLAAPAGAAARKPAEASANLPTLFSDEDYPAAAIRNHEQGPVAFRLEIGADGTPTGCSVTSSSGSSILDSTTCRLLMERARFRPARDSRGRAVPDSYSGRIVWRLPDDDDDSAPRLAALQTLWNACVLGEAAKLLAGDLPVDEIVPRSFPACTALEALVAREVGQTAPLDAPRESMKRAMAEMLTTLRGQLKEPPEGAAPRP